MSSPLRIIVTGLIAQHPLIGGMTWHHLQYLLGLKRLGHDVYYFEDSGEIPYDPNGDPAADFVAESSAINVSHLARTLGRFGFEGKWAYRCASEDKWFGLSASHRKEVLGSADLLVNVSGSLEYPGNYRPIPHLLYIDTDPLVTQIKVALGRDEFIQRIDAHDSHFSFGERILEAFPNSPHRWQSTRQPVVLAQWRPSTPWRNCFTTIMNWTSYEPLIYSGTTYGQKDVEFKRFLELPGKLAGTPIEVALSRTEHRSWQEKDGDSLSLREEGLAGKPSSTPRDLISSAGFRVVDAFDTCGDLDSYRKYIESSKAEWGVAKNAYVLGQPGWFSERSACYLAAGRPVVVQDTGFSPAIPVGEGILSFRTLQDAVDAIHEVEANYSRHAEAARSIAETYFGSDDVLGGLIERALCHDDRQRTSESTSPGT